MEIKPASSLYTRITNHAAKVGLTLEQLCEQCDIPYQTVLGWKHNPPKSVRKITKLLTYKTDDPA